MTDAALQSLGDAALAANSPAEAVAALDEYSQTTQRPALLLLRGEAREQAGKTARRRGRLSGPLHALRHQRTGAAGRHKARLPARQPRRKVFRRSRSINGSRTPRLQFGAKSWSDARNEYATILPELSGADRERAQLRIMECGVALGAAPAEMAALQITDPDVDAERLDSLAEYYRAQQQEAQMVAADRRRGFARAIEPLGRVRALPGGQLLLGAARSRPRGGLLQATRGKFPDVSGCDVRAVARRVDRGFKAAAGSRDDAARSPAAISRLAVHARRALLARPPCRRSGSGPARASLLREIGGALSRKTIFRLRLSARVRALGPGPADIPDVLASIPPVSPIPKLDGPIPLAAVGRQARADALRSIAFDASAELELRAGYAATGEPRLLLEAAQAAAAAGHYGAAIVTVRQIFPQLESQPFSDVPRDVWRVAYALPFEASIRRWSAKAGVDPMLVAGLIRQESAFRAGGALGKERDRIDAADRADGSASGQAGKNSIIRARGSSIRITTSVSARSMSRALQKQFGGAESALAAYNAGEDRVTSWTAGQAYRETAEFVDSIPFTETRQYVQIVTRNADIYRRLYGAQPDESRPARTRRGR